MRNCRSVPEAKAFLQYLADNTNVRKPFAFRFAFMQDKNAMKDYWRRKNRANKLEADAGKPVDNVDYPVKVNGKLFLMGFSY